MCFSIKLVVCRDSPKGRDLGCEKGQTQITFYKSIVKSLMPQGVGFSAGQSKLKKKKKDEKDSAPKLSIFLSSIRTCSCFDDIWYTLHMVTYDHSLLEPSQKKGREMTNCNSSTSYEATPSACLHMGYTFNRKYKAPVKYFLLGSQMVS